MKKASMFGIAAIVVGGILLTLSNENYQMYQLLDRLVQENDHVCDADFCDTSYLLIPAAYFQTSIGYLIGGVALSAIGASVLVKRQEIDP